VPLPDPATQEKFMSKRIFMVWSGLMTAACVVMGGFVYRALEHSAQVNRALMKDMQAHRELLEQSRTLNQAPIERPSRDDNGASQRMQGVDSTARGWVSLSLRLVKDQPAGEPAAGYTIKLTNSSDDPHATVIDLSATSDADGRFDAGLLAPGRYHVELQTPWNETANQRVQLRAGRTAQVEEIICPGEALPELDVTFEIDWPQDFNKYPDVYENSGVYLEPEERPRDIVGLAWSYNPPVPLPKHFVVMKRGILLQSGAGVEASPAVHYDPSREVKFDKDEAGSVENALVLQLLSNFSKEDEIDKFKMKSPIAIPEPRVRWAGSRCAFRVKGIVIMQELGSYPYGQRILIKDQSAETGGEFKPGEPGARVRIQISSALATLADRVLARDQLISRDAEAKRDEEVESDPLPDKEVRVEANAANVYNEAAFFAKYRKTDLAIERATGAITKNDKPAAMYMVRSLLFQFKGRPEDADRDLGAAVRLDPENAGLYYQHRADVWRDLGKIDQALADYAESLRLNADLTGVHKHSATTVYKHRGRIFEENWDLGNALADYTEAIERGLDLYSERAALYVKLENFDAAIEDYSHSIDRDDRRDGFSQFTPARAHLYWERNDLDQAAPDFAAIDAWIGTIKPGDLATAPRSLQNGIARLRDQIAWFLATAGAERCRNGARALEQAIDLCILSSWNNSEFFPTLAAAYAETGNFDLAARWEAKALETMNDGKSQPDPEEVKQPGERLALYRSGKPYREYGKPRTFSRAFAKLDEDTD
jgi:tetratricopeptide (TPR) repeat protein